MSAIEDGGPAFPCESYGLKNGKETTVPAQGMSLRAWLAGKALQGLMVDYYTHGNTIPECVDLALFAADALIAKLKGSSSE